MAYVINKSDGTALTTLEDATIDNSTSITLVGRNYIGYGEAQNENFLFLLENFANNIAPSRPVKGQIWFDTDLKICKVYDGTKWTEVGAATISATPPEEPPTGAFWFKTGVNTLHTYDGNGWVFIGPEASEGFGLTRGRSTTLRSNTGITYPVILFTVNDIVLGIMASNTFTINASNAIPGFSDLEAGLTLSSSVYLKGNLKGNADTATRLNNARQINGVGFDGTQNITITASTSENLRAGDYIVGDTFNGSSDVTWSIDATSANSIGKIVARNSSGGFSAGLITANLAGNVTGNVTATSGTSTFNIVEATRFIGESLSGNAFTATKLQTAREINGVRFDGQSDITVPAAANTLTGNSLANGVIYSDLQRIGTLADLSVTGNVEIGSGLTASATSSASQLDALRSITITADDGTNTTAIKLISPDVSVLAGTGAKGGLTPTTNLGSDLGKSTLKWDNVYGNLFVGDLQGNADTATLATTATNIAGGAAGSLAYQTASGATSLLPIGAEHQVLKVSGGTVQWGSASLAEIIPGNYITGNNYDGLSTQTWAVDADSANTASKVVARDSSGNFAAGTITANVTGNVTGNSSTATALQTARTINGVSFDGTGNITITATDPNALPKAGGTMTGKITLDGDPTSALHAVTKQYVDTLGAPVTIYYGASSCVGFTNQVGSFNDSSNYFDVFPPSGYTMANLKGFIPSIRTVHYAGGVDGNDSIRCQFEERSDRIRVWVQNTEQRSTPTGNFFSVWQ